MIIPAYNQEIDQILQQIESSACRSIVITSINPGEGVSSLSASLVNRLMLNGKKTLLVDLNPQSPSLDVAIEQIPPTPDSNSDAAALFHSELMMTKEGQALLHASQLNSGLNSSAKLRQPGVFKRHLQQWCECFDYIIIDSPCVQNDTTTTLPCTQIIQQCDGAVLVTLAGVTTESMLVQALDKLTLQRQKIIGIVVNDRFNPGLKSELLREIDKLSALLPSLFSGALTYCRKLIRNNRLLALDL
ncbi:cellulose synthase operon protein YhjQ/BcsQ [Agaribacterium haliotis]|uniref:cellulose synthase operon protein YhjQ/BcsQ n=1 Tax=Agaribacterium haliotis TaxID=2013869 RepID=UPI000BB584E4|nr:cellulose synthase operon protein YhjQ/BcsQ [Agaribacterium haliotis]